MVSGIGNLQPMGGSVKTISAILAQRCERQPDASTFTFLEKRGARELRQSHGQLLSAVQSIAYSISERTKRQDVVGCLLEPGLDFISCFFGILWSGRIALPIAPPRSAQDCTNTKNLLQHAGARLCLSSQEAIRRFADANVSFGCDVLGAHDAASDYGLQSPTTRPGDIAVLQYTSGTTGRPKGVVVTHDNLMCGSRQIAQAFDHSNDSVGVIWLPPHHDMGLIGGLIQPLFAGFPVYLMSPAEFLRNPFTWLQAISRYRATTSGGPNFSYEQCIRRITAERRRELDLSSWRVAFCGAEPIRADTLERFSAAFGQAGFQKSAFVPCYGLAEATLMVTCHRTGQSPVILHDTSGHADGSLRYVSCGRVAEPSEVLIVDPQSGQPVEEGRTGEIWIRGPNVAAGYWNDTVAGAATFGASVPEIVPADYLRSGDLGFMREGQLFVCGRLKAQVIVRGINYSLEDIEELARSAHPELPAFQCAAFVMSIDGEEAIAIAHEASAGLREAQNEITRAIREKVVAGAGICPAHICLTAVGALPRTRSGKIRRQACDLLFGPAAAAT
jgi:acyl-CoA synthetase (AMP-forming)/AMP-acid ligase II